MRWRCIGPFRGGRVVAVAGDPSDRLRFYFGACAGGVWGTTDGGAYWENVSDGFFGTAAVGAIAVAESDPNVIYAGTGEACIRGNVSHGDGVYRSTDGGKTWTNIGLQDTRHIARIRVHSRNPDLVYVAALGHAFGPNEERGVFRSADGGGTWEKVLFKSEKAGAADLSMDPNNPRIMYAALWQALRQPWNLVSGGPDSGLYKTTDGGDTWEEITQNQGLPAGLKGRMGVAVSPARRDRVWAIIEAEEGGLYRSDDGGSIWERVSDDRNLLQRPWYYTHVVAHPRDPDTVYVLNLKAWVSTDGGCSFTQMTTPHGDNHDLWIDPRDPERMIEGNDGGACVSFNGGATWSTIYNQPTAQHYHVATDNQFPYRVYGTQQDNSAISVPSSSYVGAITWGDCYVVGSSESGHIAVRPDDPNIVYSGAIGSSPGGGDSLLRYDHSTGQTRIVSVWPEFYYGWGAKHRRHRFQWTYPIVISPHDPGVLYVAAERVFRSDDEGMSWRAISPDLTRADETKMEAPGGPITLDTTGAEVYGTIFALAESPHQRGLFWAGSDDGLVHISRDGGESWENVTPVELPEWSLITTIEISPHDPATAYLAATRYRLDDTRPYLYKTSDYGTTWTKITGGLPEHDFTRVIREDPERPGLLYCGTETGVYVSFDDGASWRSLRVNPSADSGRGLPVVPVHDIVVKDNDLVAATHGRSFWILDGLATLRQLDEGFTEEPVHLLKPAPAYRVAPEMGSTRPTGPGKNYMLGLGQPATFYESKTAQGETVRRFLDAGANPSAGVVVSYYLKERPEDPLKLTFVDSSGEEIKGFMSRAAADDPPEGREGPFPAAEKGMNRFVWDMRYPDAHAVRGEGAGEKALAGPMVPPGTYQVRLTADGHSETQSFDLLKDPRVSATQGDLEEQHALLVRVRDKLSEAHDAISRIRGIRRQVDEWAGRAGARVGWEGVSERATGLKEKLAAIEEELVQVKYVEPTGNADRISLPSRLNRKLAELASVPASADSVPTQAAYQVLDDLSERTDVQLRRLDEVVDNDLAVFGDLLHEMEIPAVIPDAGV